jgi:hypothetical protein
MPDRFRTRKHLPFVALPCHKRRDAVVRLGWKIARQPEGYSFWTDHLLIDPEDPTRIHHWVDVYFLAADHFTFWNAEIVTLQLARQDAVEGRSFKLAYAQLSEQEIAREFAFETVAVPRTRPGQMRTRQWVQQPVQRYPQFEGRSFREECQRLETSLLASEPPEVSECFEIDQSYAYGIGLHAVVDELTLDAAAIERCIKRFRERGEREWRSA